MFIPEEYERKQKEMETVHAEQNDYWPLSSLKSKKGLICLETIAFSQEYAGLMKEIVSENANPFCNAMDFEGLEVEDDAVLFLKTFFKEKSWITAGPYLARTWDILNVPLDQLPNEIQQKLKIFSQKDEESEKEWIQKLKKDAQDEFIRWMGYVLIYKTDPIDNHLIQKVGVRALDALQVFVTDLSLRDIGNVEFCTLIEEIAVLNNVAYPNEEEIKHLTAELLNDPTKVYHDVYRGLYEFICQKFQNDFQNMKKTSKLYFFDPKK